MATDAEGRFVILFSRPGEPVATYDGSELDGRAKHEGHAARFDSRDDAAACVRARSGPILNDFVGANCYIINLDHPMR